MLGATGSIGENTLRILEKHPDKLELVGVAAHSSTPKLSQIIKQFDVPHAAIFTDKAYTELKRLGHSSTQLHTGLEGLNTLAALPEADLVVIAVVGAIGIHPTLAAIQAGNNIAIANKEPLVMAGEFIMQAAKAHHVRILPIDSEHNSIFQCIEGIEEKNISQVVLTASGGIFRDFTVDQLSDVTPAQATKHPNWDMGAKVTIDSSTLVNKGLELIEAKWLFDLEPKQLDAVIHRQSIIHSLITLVDGCILSQLNPPSMTFAIQHCLLYPNRAEGVDPTLDFSERFNLTLEPIDTQRFPAFQIAKDCLSAQGCTPAIFNASNEIAVQEFIAGNLAYVKIPQVIAKTLDKVSNFRPNSLETILEVDKQARITTKEIIQTINSSVLIP